jgi:hypothetical protein
MNLDARIREARKVRQGHSNGDGRGSSDDVGDFFSNKAVVSGIVSKLSSSIRTVGSASSLNQLSELAKCTGSMTSSTSTSFEGSCKCGSS